MSPRQKDINEILRNLRYAVELDTWNLTRDDISGINVRIWNLEKYINDVYAIRTCSNAMLSAE